jgi:hypothetical protein
MTPVGQEHRELEIAGGAAGTFQAASWSEAGSCPDTLPAPAQPTTLYNASTHLLKLSPEL